MSTTLMTHQLKKISAATCVLVLMFILRRLLHRKTNDKSWINMPNVGYWYLFQLVWDGKNANRKLYEKYGHHGVIKVKGISLTDEAVLFDLRDVAYAHKHEGENPGGAGDILFNRMTRFFEDEFGSTSHGRNLYGRGFHHNKTRDMVMGGKMVAFSSTIKAAKEVVDHLSRYKHLTEWSKLAVIDLFLAEMVGSTPDLTNPDTHHPLKELPEDEEKTFLFGLLLSVLPKFMHFTMEDEYVHAMRRMTHLGVEQANQFLAIPDEQRPECFFKSVLRNGATARDVQELLSFFITVFSVNTSLTLQNFIFHVATNPDKQELLHREIDAISPDVDLSEAPMPYYEAFMRESHRITPIIDFTQVRTYEHEMILPSGWQIPAGTKLMFLNQQVIRDEKYVPDPGNFQPERFLGDKDNDVLHHFLQKSEFGSSTRSCLGRRTAGVMLRAVVIELLRRYRLEALPSTKSFTIDTSDPSFNRIANYPRIVLHEKNTNSGV